MHYCQEPLAMKSETCSAVSMLKTSSFYMYQLIVAEIDCFEKFQSSNAVRNLG
jgi:hypothetical protein